MIYKSILDTVGHTPIVELKKVIPSKSPHTFLAKLEYFNPGLSVKDRIALSLIEEAEKRGELKKGGVVIEATSGNTGMGLALVCAVRGYRCIFVVADKVSEEKRAGLKAYGAEVVVTPTDVEPEDPRSYVSVAQRLSKTTQGAFLVNQYHNPDNPKVHYKSTGPEIWNQTQGDLDVFVAGAGTGGTVSGVGKYLKEQKPEIQILCPDPVGSILHDLFHYKEVREPAKPYFVEGVGEDMLPDNVHMDFIDAFVRVSDGQAFSMARQLAREEGLCVGPSSGLALSGALAYAEKLEKPSRILVMMADSGRAYLSKMFNDSWLKENNL